jgi:hypothetical protein
MNNKMSVKILVATTFTLPILLFFAGFYYMPLLHPTESIHSLTLPNQIIVVFTAFVIKPLYMLFSLVLAWLIRKSHETDLIALRWGLLAFFCGEFFCAINYLIFQDQSYFAEYLHNFGMVVSFGFLCYALLEGLDERIIKYSNPQKQCAFIGLCGSCIKTQPVACRVKNLLQATSLSLGLFAVIPLTITINEISYNSYIFSTFYNYTWQKADQLFEIRYCPIVALAMFLTTFIITQRSKDHSTLKTAQIFISAGVGALGFSMFRLFLNTIYMQNLSLADSWEELSEFLMIIIIAYILYQFHQRLNVNVG